MKPENESPRGTPGGGGPRFGERVVDLAALVGWMLFLAFCMGSMVGLFVSAMLIMMVVFL